MTNKKNGFCFSLCFFNSEIQGTFLLKKREKERKRKETIFGKYFRLITSLTYSGIDSYGMGSYARQFDNTGSNHVRVIFFFLLFFIFLFTGVDM